jgi:hypothetical protein
MGTMLWSREQVWAAVFAAWSAPCLAAGLKTASRVVRHYTEVDQGDMPYAAQLQKGEVWKRVRGLPPAIELRGEILIYTHSEQNNPANPQSGIINAMLDILQQSLGDVTPDNNNTLGQTPGVQHIWIEDNIQIYEGILVNTSIAIVPVHILVGSNIGS